MKYAEALNLVMQEFETQLFTEYPLGSKQIESMLRCFMEGVPFLLGQPKRTRLSR